MEKKNVWENELKELKERMALCPERTTHIVKINPDHISFYYGGDYDRSFHPEGFSTYGMNWFEFGVSYGQEPPTADEIRAVAALTKLEHLLPEKITNRWRETEREFTTAARKALEEIPVYSWAEYTRKV